MKCKQLILAVVFITSTINADNACINDQCQMNNEAAKQPHSGHYRFKPELIQKLMRHNLSTLEWVDEDWPNESFGAYITRCMTYQRELQPAKKRRIGFNILKSHVEKIGYRSSHVLDDAITWDDLNLFRGSANSPVYFAQKIDNTYTELGKVMLCSYLAHPIVETDELKNRQAVLKELVTNDELVSKLKVQYEKLKKHENILYSFWANDPLKHAVARHYFKVPFFEDLQKTVNENPWAIEAKGVFDHQKRSTFFVSGALASLVLPLYGVMQIAKINGPIQFSRVAEKLIGTGGAFYALLSLIENQFVQGASSIIAGIYGGLSTKDDFEWMRDNFVLIRNLQEKLIDVASFLKATREISNSIQHSQIITQSLPTVVAFKELFDELPKRSPDVKKLFDLLESRTLEGKPSLFSHQGNILVAYMLLHELKESFESALCALGELDAYLSIAQLIKNHENQRVSYLFAEFVEAPMPMVHAQNFWNPYINPEVVVTNSIELGIDGNQRIGIVSGPNAAGKSTAIKALVLNIILAQSFGIAAAKQLRLRPFDWAGTYLNVVDDIANGNSLFKAQVVRLENLFSQVKNLKPNQFWFLAIDEMFNGTSAKEGQALSYCVAKDLALSRNSMCMLATHFPLLTTLEKENSAFVNYKVSASIRADGTIYYPFIIERGISSQNVAIDILRQEGFKSTILEEAQKLIKQ